MARSLVALLFVVILAVPAHSQQSRNKVTGDRVALAPVKTRPQPPSAFVRQIHRDEILPISQTIDAMVVSKLQEQGIQPHAIANDEVFLRRAFLQIAGRIPTLVEARSFLDDNRKDKRANLIDDLLDSDAYVSHQFNFWADLLRVKQRLMGGVPGKPYKDFIKDAIAENMPYDEFVRAMITANGPALERGNGATGYYLRDMGMPEDNMSNTVRVFLGTRLECAQCHDHPFDTWTQMDYFRMVAFTGGVRTRLETPNSPRARAVRRMLNDQSLSQNERRALRRLVQPLNLGVEGGGTGLARLPEDYQYDDGDPLEIVTAQTIFASPGVTLDPHIPRQSARGRRANKRRPQIIRGASDIDSREAYAAWLTSPENPRFATVIANRMWKYALGVGLIEPVDDFNDETVASNPKLMEYLAEQMVTLDFDLKQYLRAIYLTNTFQRQAARTDIASDDPYYFPGPIVRRMSAEQLWDSLVTLTVPNVDQRENTLRAKGLYAGRLMSGDIYNAYEKLRELSLEEIKDLAEQGRNRPMMAMEMMTDAEKNTRTNRAKVTKKQRQLRKKIAQARRNKNHREARRLQDELKSLMDDAREAFAFRDFVRASELFSPMRPGHFLREFGQSDREQIDNANDEPAVTQVLSLMNGVLEKRIVNNPYSMLMKNIAAAQTPIERLDAAFLTILSRYPTQREARSWVHHMAHGGQGRDVIWVLANTHEFMFVQ